MFSKISIENFKCLKSVKDLEIKPVTILCGTNSSGKSTILQSLLLQKQTFESKNPNQTILLNGPFAHLGIFKNIIYGKNPNNQIIFRFDFNIKSDDIIPKNRGSLPLRYILRQLTHTNSVDNEKYRDIEYRVIYEYGLSILPQQNEEYLNKINIDYLRYRINAVCNGNDYLPESEVTLNYNKENHYKLYWKNLKGFGERDDEHFSNEGISIKLNIANISSLSFSALTPDRTQKTREPILYIHYFNDILSSIFSSYTYLGPLREEPARRYIYEDEIIEIGIKGENAAYIYLTEKSDKLDEHYFYDYNNRSFYADNNKISLEDALIKWLEIMNIHGFKPNPQNEIIQLNFLSNTIEDTEVSIADVGFGVSQIFPILLEGLRMPKGHTLILEQPEIHLHPKLQTQLSDYFISLALSKRNVLVETHSDHIINRLVRRIVEDNEYNLKDLIAIYFLEPSMSGSIFNKVEIDESHGIINWPKEFFDQNPLEQENIIKAGLNKRNKLRGN